MPKPVAIPPPGFDQLTVEEQIDYVQLLWERIAATPDQVPVPDWHRERAREGSGPDGTHLEPVGELDEASRRSATSVMRAVQDDA